LQLGESISKPVLLALLQREGLSDEKINGDGNCFFVWICRILRIHDEQHYHLRCAILAFEVPTFCQAMSFDIVQIFFEHYF